MFRDRPLTWLFIVATVCLNFVFTGYGSGDIVPRVIGTGFFLGQSLSLGSWLAVGSRHRLERGAVFVVGHVLLTVFICFGFAGEDFGSWGRVIAALSLYGFAGFSGAFFGKIGQYWISLRFSEEPNERLRFPIIELFGWTVVVAIASAVMRQANFTHLLSGTNMLVFFVGSALLTGLATAILMRPTRNLLPRGIALAAFVPFFIAAYTAIKDSELVTSLLLAVVYTMLWTVVVRLDAPSPVRTAPHTASDDQTSPPPLGDRHASARPDLRS